jgi:hypothetical protein
LSTVITESLARRLLISKTLFIYISKENLLGTKPAGDLNHFIIERTGRKFAYTGQGEEL